MNATVEKRLLELLAKIDRPGTFCASGELPTILPGLEVAGMGPIGLPLDEPRATALKKRARQAPYGKGTQTVVDTDVRRVWEIDADQVVLANPRWNDVIIQAVEVAQTELGLETRKLEAHLYKLLLYEPGSFFLTHRDGEKLDGMVATLVVALPSLHAGGELAVRHEGREVVVDFSAKSEFHTQFAAFYADCDHEIRPVTSGYRLALVYNLTLEKSKERLAAPVAAEHVPAAARLLVEWDGRLRADSESSRRKLAVILEHRYTKAGLTRDALKGLDRARAGVLFSAAREAGFDASLATVTYWVSGEAVHTGRSRPYGRSKYEWRDDYEPSGTRELGEIYEEALTAERFSDADGNRLDYGRVSLDEEEVVSATSFGDGDPDREDFEDFTGNAGMTLERWYHHAAVLLWPTRSRFDVLITAGVDAAVQGLDLMVRRLETVDEGERPRLRQECLDFASRITAHWSSRRPIYLPSIDPAADAEEKAAKPRPRSFPDLLEKLDDVSSFVAWIREVPPRDEAVDPFNTLEYACRRHGWKTFQDALTELFEKTSERTLVRNARLLAEISLLKDRRAGRKALCSELANRMVSLMERGVPKHAPNDWGATKTDPVGVLVSLIRSLLALNERALFDRLTTVVHERPKEFDLTKTRVPVLLELEPGLRQTLKQPSDALRRWLSAALDELTDRESKPPTAPSDWRRDSNTGCNCADCATLRRFLDDPALESMNLPLSEQRRRHLHEIIDRKKLDTTHVTERKGRPFALILRKTAGSFERALHVYRVDLDHLAKVRSMFDWHEAL